MNTTAGTTLARRPAFDLGKALGLVFAQRAGVPALRGQVKALASRRASSVMVDLRPITRSRRVALDRALTQGPAARARPKLSALDPFAGPAVRKQPQLARLFEESRKPTRNIRLQRRSSTVGTVEGTASVAEGWSRLQDSGQIKIQLQFYESPRMSPEMLRVLADRPIDTVFRRAGDKWQIVGDDDSIDLSDSSQEFRLGAVTFYS